MRLSKFSDFDILDNYIEVLHQLRLGEQTIWDEFRNIRHINFHCLFWDGSEEGLIN